MGKRYESKRGEVRDAREEGERIREDKETVKNEYSLLSSIESILGDIDDEVLESVIDVESVGEQEDARLETEHLGNDAEKAQIASDIDEELDKLRNGMSSLEAVGDNPFGKNSVEQAKIEYEDQAEKYRELIDELEIDENGGEPGSGFEHSGVISDVVGETNPDIISENDLFSDVLISSALEPNLATPRNLATTSYGFSIGPNGEQTYDSPMEMDRYLYAAQGSAYTNFQGTCGLCSIANIMRLAGVNVSEKDVIDYAANTKASDNPFANIIPWANKLCSVNPLDPGASGGTNPNSRQRILEHFGVSSDVVPVKMEGGIASNETLESIAQYVSDGRGVILSVHASVLEPQMYVNDLDSDFHAVTVTSVTRNKYGDVSGFYICDSNKGTSYYPAFTVQNALTGADMNVTRSRIR